MESKDSLFLKFLQNRFGLVNGLKLFGRFSSAGDFKKFGRNQLAVILRNDIGLTVSVADSVLTLFK